MDMDEVVDGNVSDVGVTGGWTTGVGALLLHQYVRRPNVRGQGPCALLKSPRLRY